MKTFGRYVGVFLDGVQVGAGRDWCLDRDIPCPQGDGAERGPAGGGKEIPTRCWRGHAEHYKLTDNRALASEHLTFRFVDDFMYLECEGRIETKSAVVGQPVDGKLVMAGTGSVKALFPKEE